MLLVAHQGDLMGNWERYSAPEVEREGFETVMERLYCSETEVRSLDFVAKSLAVAEMGDLAAMTG